MPPIPIDFSQVKDLTVPEWYTLQIQAAEPARSKAGNPVLRLQWKVVGEQWDGVRPIFDNLNLDGKGLFRTRDVLEALGIALPVKDSPMYKNFKLEPADLIGEICQGYVTEEEYVDAAGNKSKSYRVKRVRKLVKA